MRHFSLVQALVFWTLTASAFSLNDTSLYKIEFISPDTSYYSADSLRIAVSLSNQINGPAIGKNVLLTVRAISGTGIGSSSTIVNQQSMTDMENGTYTYQAIDISTSAASSYEIRVRATGDGNQRIEKRILVVHDTTAGDAVTPWKIEITNLEPTLNGDSSIVVVAKITGASGSGLAGQSVMLSILDSSNQPLSSLGGLMAGTGNGFYQSTISSSLLINGADYIFSAVTLSQPSLYGQICCEIYKEVIHPPEIIQIEPETTTVRRPELKWHPVEGAETYTIQLDTFSRFPAPILSVPTSDTSYTPTINLPMRTIYWRVSSSRSPLLYSETGSFTIIDGNVPIPVPVIPDPTTNRRPTLSWSTVIGTETYMLQIDTTILFSNPLFSIPTSDTTFTSTVDLPIKKIYWRVKSDLSEKYSSTSSFTIQADTIPSLFRFYGDTLAERRPLFRWNTIERATAYTIQISHTRNFSNIQISTPLSDTIYSPLINLDTASKYFWRVSSDLNNSIFSSADSFIIIIRPTDAENKFIASMAPTLTIAPNPASGAASIALSGLASHSGVVLFKIYDLTGKLVTEINGIKRNGQFVATWSSNSVQATGVYVIRTDINGKLLERKLFLLK